MNKFKTLFFSIILALAVAAITFAWTNPSANPPTGGGALSYSDGNINVNSHKITNLATPVDDTDAATKGYADAQAGWHGCYRKTCETHNTASCTVASCDTGETDKGNSCPRNGGLWTAQDNPSGYTCVPYCGIYADYHYGSKFTADYYVTCERWCCK